MFAAWHFIGISKISIMKISWKTFSSIRYNHFFSSSVFSIQAWHESQQGNMKTACGEKCQKCALPFLSTNCSWEMLLNYTFFPLIQAQTASNWIYYTFAQMCENHLSLSTFLFFWARSHLARRNGKGKEIICLKLQSHRRLERNSRQSGF